MCALSRVGSTPKSASWVYASLAASASGWVWRAPSRRRHRAILGCSYWMTRSLPSTSAPRLHRGGAPSCVRSWRSARTAGHDRGVLAPPRRLPVCGCGRGPARGQDRGNRNACRVGGVRGSLCADLPSSEGGRDDRCGRSAQVSSLVLTRNAGEDRARSLLRSLLSLLWPWRVHGALVAMSVLAAAAFELVPPLIIRTIVDAHLIVRQPDGLLFLAFLYLAASAAVQVMTFLYNYLAATIAQGVLSALRVRLFAHVLRLPTSYFDRVPMGDVISRCTADVETLDTVFSSNVALLLANLVRLGAITVAMFALSIPLSLVAALVVPPLAFVTRVLQRRVRQAERENRLAVGAINARLQENLRSTEVIRAFGRVPEFVAGFRQILRRGLAASNRSSFFSSVYTPMTAILSALAVAALLWAGTQQAFAAFGVSLGTLTAFLLLMQRFFQPITALGEEWQTVQGAMAGAERIFETLALARDEPRTPGLTRSNEVRPTSSLMLDEVQF